MFPENGPTGVVKIIDQIVLTGADFPSPFVNRFALDESLLYKKEADDVGRFGRLQGNVFQHVDVMACDVGSAIPNFMNLALPEAFRTGILESAKRRAQ